MSKATFAPHDQKRSEKIDQIIPGFTGLNLSDPTSVGDTDLTDCLNVAYDLTGALESRLGTSKLLTTSLADGILGIHPFYNATSSLKQLLYASGSTQYRYDNAGGSVSLSSGLAANRRWEYATSKGKTFAVDGFGGLYQFTGTGSYTLVSATYKFVCIWFYKNRLYGFEANSSILRFSNAGDPTTFPVNNFIEVNTDDGQILTGLDDDTDSLTMHKTDTIWYITGEPLGSGDNTTLGNLQLRKANSEVGTCSFRTMQKISRGLSIFAAIDGIYILQNFRSQNISADIERLFKIGMNPNFMNLCWGNYNKTEKKYLLGFPSETSTTCDKIIMLDFSVPNQVQFAVWDNMPGSCAISFKFQEGRETTLIGHPTRGYIYQAYHGYSDISPGDNGTATSGANIADAPYTQVTTSTATTINLALNPGFEVDTSQWTLAGASATLSRNTGVTTPNGFSVTLTGPSAAGASMTQTVLASCGAGRTFTLSAYIHNVGGIAQNIYVYHNGVNLSPAINSATNTGSGYIRYTCTVTTTAASGTLQIIAFAAPSSGYDLGCIQLEEVSTASAFFDGATVDTATNDYSWTGTAYSSTSSRIITTTTSTLITPTILKGRLTNTVKNWTPDVHKDAVITILAGTGRGQKRFVASNTATVITIEDVWLTPPDATSLYTIGGYKSYGDSKIFNQRKPALDKKYSALDVFTDAKSSYDLQLDIAYGGLPLGDFTEILSLDSGAMKWGMIDPDTGFRMKWGKPGKKWGGQKKLHRRLNLGGGQAKKIQYRFGNDKANQPWRLSEYVTTYTEKKNRPD